MTSEELRQALTDHEFDAEEHECSCGWERDWSKAGTERGYDLWIDHFDVIQRSAS